MRSERNFLLVGHSGWARFAFSAFLQPAKGDWQAMQPTTHQSNLQLGAREGFRLPNCGFVCAVLKCSMFESVQIDGFNCNYITGRKKRFPNKLRRPQSNPIGSLEEAIRARVVPDDAKMERMSLGKKRKLGGVSDCIFTLSASNGVAHLAWANKWGKPKKIIAINGGQMEFKTRPSRWKVSIKHVSWDKGKVMELKAHSAADFEKFVQRLTEFQNYHLVTI